MRRKLGILAGISAAFILAAAAPSHAQDYPNKPLTMIAPFDAGSATDTFARAVADKLGKVLGQPVVVESIPGANGTIGTMELLKRPADGYTLMLGTSSTHAANFGLYKKVPYELSNFSGLGCLARVPAIIAIRSSLGINSLQDLVAYSKANPGKLTYGWASSTTKVGAELLRIRAGVDLRGISYRGTPQIVTDMLGDRVDLFVDNPIPSAPHIESGAMKALAVLTDKRATAMPNLPTMEELGVPNATLSAWFIAAAKAGTPKPVLDKLAQAVAQVANSPEHKDYVLKAKNEPFNCTADELDKFVVSEKAKWIEMLKLAGIEPQ